jgi:hypothetical protein
MSPDDPRHGTHAGYLAHHADDKKPCDACMDANYVYRKRLTLDKLSGVRISYGADDLEAVLRPWLDMGFSPSAIAEAAGMDSQRGKRLCDTIENRQVVRRGTYQRLAAITEDDFTDGARIYADLTRFRIYSLMAIGHRLIDMPVNESGYWRTRERVAVGMARAVRDYYRAHEFEIGPDRHTMARARNGGHIPPLAWDDPGGLAWPNPDKRTHRRPRPVIPTIDEAVVLRLLGGERIRASRAERDEAMRRWKAMGRSERSLCEIHGWRDGRYGRDVA